MSESTIWYLKFLEAHCISIQQSTVCQLYVGFMLETMLWFYATEYIADLVKGFNISLFFLFANRISV